MRQQTNEYQEVISARDTEIERLNNDIRSIVSETDRTLKETKDSYEEQLRKLQDIPNSDTIEIIPSFELQSTSEVEDSYNRAMASFSPRQIRRGLSHYKVASARKDEAFGRFALAEKWIIKTKIPGLYQITDLGNATLEYFDD